MGFMEGKKELLTSDLVERGRITKQLLFKSDKVEVALLELGIDAKIKDHFHWDSNEKYYNAETGNLESEVTIGNNHSLTNSTGRPLRVIAVKEFIK